MKAISKVTLSLVCASVLLSGTNSLAQANEKAYNVINLTKAKQENPNINGAGVVVGVLDSVFNTNNPIIQNKLINSINNSIDPDRFSGSNLGVMTHGTQVSSLIVGDSAEFKGVANGATFYGLGLLNPSPSYTGNIKADVQKMIDSGVKVINHSYNLKVFPLINRYWGDGLQNIYMYYDSVTALNQGAFQQLDNISAEIQRAQDLAELSKNQGILNIVGAGNDGFSSPGGDAILASYDEDYRGLLAVGGLNAEKVTIQQDGNITIGRITDADRTEATSKWSQGRGDKSKVILNELITKQGIYTDSNFFAGSASLYGIMAPAQNIAVANGRYGYSYYDANIQGTVANNSLTSTASGTSFSTPLVSGVAALVEQKFPFLDGSQIADVLLTTANKNVTTPKLVVTRNTGSTGKAEFYSIFYINHEVPKNGNGSGINWDKVKQDLEEAGFKSSDNDNGVAEYIINNLLKSDADVRNGLKANSAAVIKLSKEDFIGSGILDARKALKGLAALNINRLNPSDIENFNNQYYGFYTINTKGLNGTFTNNIDEIKWNDKYHLSDAINSLKSDNRVNLSTLQAGFIKTGDGNLTFSQNTLNYSGPTIARGGILEFDRVTANNSALYADNGGQILISGETNAKQNLYAINGGLATISGTLASGHVFARNGGIIGGNGIIRQNLTNESGIVMPGGEGQIGVLNVNGTYTQDINGNLHINFNNQANSDINATSYDIKGGNLVYIPLSGQFFYDGQEIVIDFATLDNNGNLDKFTQISVQDTSTLNFELKDNNQTSNENTANSTSKNIIIVEIKKDAYKPVDAPSEVGNAISEIKSLPNLNQSYQNFFGGLDSASSERKNEILSSVSSIDTLTSTKNTINNQNRFILNNLSSLTGFMSGTTKVANIAKNSQLALINSGMTDNMVYDILKSYNAALSKSEISSRVSYSYSKGDDYNTNRYSVDLGAKTWVSDDVKLGVFLNYSHQKEDYEFSQTTNKLISAGLNGFKDFGDFNLLASVDVGMGFNDMSRYILTLNDELKADYNSYFVSTGLGLSKDFAINDSFTWTPISMLNYIYSKQDGFEESGGIFAKGYKDISINSLNLSLGGNIAYNIATQNNLFATLNGFAFYTRRLNGDSFSSTEYFVDAGNLWTQRTKLNTDSVYFGADANIEKGNKFINFLVSSEITKDEYSVNTAIRAGIRF
ncbi:S8 family serine peptidase [Campylobacter lanienae]|uniref:S8 family serine peptidase n=1 Tax=Campylobacter lanienae TaxID=75658 RepID=UPI002A91C933|nr:S8 family serine peptidase [Campylobacter lanienae]MDY6134393.1 S8 family serine peptidase [Campylobacter lanienae]